MPVPVQMSAAQKVCFDAAMESQNLFISGPGGVGKSFILEEIIKELRARKRAFRATASTGIAALNIQGSTIHSLLGTGIRNTIEEATHILGSRPFHFAQSRLNYCSTLIVDEISMLSGDYISMMDFWLRQVRNNADSFGGMQMIFCGDFLQLPPVEKGAAPKYRYAFQSPAWEGGSFKTIDLTRSFRQVDQTFVNALNRVRFGDYNGDVRKVFKPCIGRELVNPTHLVATNGEAADINFNKLRAHEGVEYKHRPSFDIKVHSKKFNKDDLRNKLVRNSLTENPLRLKIGVPVLLLKNNREGLYVNGSRGIVESVKLYAHGEIETIFVTLDTGNTVPVDPVDWETLSGDGKVLASMRHFPLRLGWALTIHKSQGLTLDNVEIDLAKGFANGQAYVALSRLRTLERLSLTDAIDPRIVMADKEIIEFYDKHRVSQGDT